MTITGPDGSAGHLNYQIVFTNNGPECVLKGYPQVSVLISTGSGALGASAEDDINTTATPVTLASCGTAVTALSAINIDPGSGPLGSQCSVDHGDRFNITPPNSFQNIKVQLNGVPARSDGTAWMTVGPVTSG